jgi:RND family efflux transporter MFP subunit
MNREQLLQLRENALIKAHALTDAVSAWSVRRRLAGAAAISVIALGAFYGSAGSVEANSAAIGAPQPLLLVTADLVTVETGSVTQGVKITGTLEPLQQTTVHARVNAVLDAVLVREGERVQKGQVLARQNRADVAAQLDQAQAQYVSASVELKLTEALENRKKELFEKKYLSDADWAAAQGETEVRRATLQVRESQLEMAKRSAGDALILAPISGIVARRHAEPGSNLSPGQVVMTLVNLDELELAAAIPARDIPQVQLGRDVTFSVDGYPGEIFSGKVVRINPMANGGSRTITVYARVNNRDGRLRGGMFASGRVLTQKTAGDKALRIPFNAVRHIDGGDKVWVIRDNKLALQAVVIGVRDSGGSLVEVREGLKAGERILLTDIGPRSAGTPVTVSESRPDAGAR